MDTLNLIVSEATSASLAGINRRLYAFDYASQTGVKSVSLVSTIEREDAMYEEQNIAPIGDGTKIGKKWQNWQWEPTRLYSNWEDNEDAPVEPRYSSEIKQMLDDGFQFTNDYNLLKREISRDSTMLKDHGYYISAEESVMISDLNEPVVLRSAYNADGHYIGSPEDAKFLCEECGIYPQPAKPNANICTIGKGKDGKWYGWSHRALHGFGEGDTVKQGDIAYLPDTKEAAIEKVQNFWDKSKVLIVDDTDNGFKFKISSGDLHHEEFVPRGRGEYTIASEDEAMEAAKVFAESVSTSVIDPLDFLEGSISSKVKDPAYTKNLHLTGMHSISAEALTGNVFLGFYKQSLHSDKIAIVQGLNVTTARKALDKFMSDASGSPATIYKFKRGEIESFLNKVRNKKISYLSTPHAMRLKAKGVIQDKRYVPDGVVMYDETIQVPHYDDSTVKPEEPIFPGNEKAVLQEIEKLTVLDGKFTGIFKKSNNVSKTGFAKSKGKPVLILKNSTVSRKYKNEAELFIERLQNTYGKGIKGKVVLDANKGLTVQVALLLKPYPADKQERALKLLEYWRNSKRRNSGTSEYTHLYNEIERLKNMSSKEKDARTSAEITKLERQLNKLSNELIQSKVLVQNAPMYSIKTGSAYLPVEIVGLDIPKGEVLVRLVRGRKGTGAESVKYVYSLDGTERLI